VARSEEELLEEPPREAVNQEVGFQEVGLPEEDHQGVGFQEGVPREEDRQGEGFQEEVPREEVLPEEDHQGVVQEVGQSRKLFSRINENKSANILIVVS
jgi:hypothetical protein